MRQVTIGFGFHPDWLKKQNVCSDWLEHAERVLSACHMPRVRYKRRRPKRLNQCFTMFCLDFVVVDVVFVSRSH